MGASLQQKSGRAKAGRGHRPMSEINVTPFVDVMLVLLIVFMVAAPLLTAGVPIDLPDSEAKALNQEDNKPLEVSISSDGTIFVGETEVKRDRLIQLLGSLTNNDPDRRIYIRADKTMDYGKVMDVLGAINKAGFQKVALISNAS
ncbi:MAG: protein TolR [Alphaproteobacteria bacterium]|nr:protein TolR [Alphaproteobacteria bacterium]NCQ87972.1 protein TolR [Alphaproteobacteria bacterium]NCT05521.1 protein TolR [Alphaproteobacteria bacterium]